jgi:gliding-associated putative ABC transporter substrate-binding component GldG
MLLKGSTARTADERINQSLENIEFEFVNALYKLSNTERRQIGFVQGHNELNGISIESLRTSLQELYQVSPVVLNDSLPKFNALIIAKPTQPFSQREKFYLDQYIMHGGKVLFLLDKMEVNMDSASLDNYFAFPSAMNLDDQLFRYGVRLNMNLIQDRASALYPVVTGQVDGKPQLQLMEWPFFPLINRYADHPITRNLDAVVTRFASTLDTVKAEGVKKTPLLFTSEATRVLEAPVKVSVNDLRKNVKAEDFSSGFLPVAYLLEGSFTSYVKNKILPEGVAGPVREQSKPTKLLVIADGDLAKNEVNPRSGQVQALGFDPFMNYTFANQELLLNALAYLVDENGLIMARTKEIKIRPLNKERISTEKITWQLINLVVPVLVLVGFGVARWYWRRNKYTSY